MTAIRLRYVHEFRDRFGKVRRYFRRAGRQKVLLPGLPGSAEFMDAYKAALEGEPDQREIGASRTAPGTIAAAVAAYYRSAQFVGLAASTKATYRNIIDRFREENGHRRIIGMARKHVEAMIAEKAETPTAANNLLRMVRMLMQFAMSVDMIRTDPTAGVRGVKVRSGGFHTWSEEDIQAFEAKHPVGSKARLALALLLYTAQRRGDVVRMGPQHIKGGTLTITQEKTGAIIQIPIAAPLAEIIAATPSRHLTFLVTKFGKPYSPAGFGNLFRDWCDEAGLTHCSSHGLRKAASRRLAEAGCTPHEIGAITGHRTLKEVTRYTEAANRQHLARTAMEKVSGTKTG